MKSTWLALLGGLCLAASAADTTPPATPTSIIYLIGDGMGPAYTSAYRYFQNTGNPWQVERTIFDEMLVGMASTYPNDDTMTVTDSAAAGTALAAGVKTYNGAIGIDRSHQWVKTILDSAREKGYRTGIAVTSHLNDATPAAFVAHADERHSYNKIADQYLDLRIDNKPKVDVMLGGGSDYFVRKDRNIPREFSALGYRSISDLNQLADIKKLPAIGIFAPIGLPAALDSDHPQRLAEMTDKTLSLLQGQPFFLMLEASQIDWCGHMNDIACAMGEMADMAATMKIIKHYIDEHPNTIFVATADHSTGGLTMGADGVYEWKPEVIHHVKATANTIVKRLAANKANWKTEWQALTGITLTEQEQQVMDALINVNDDTGQNKVENQAKENHSKIFAQVIAFINKYSYTGWTTNGHTGDDVQVFAYGKHREIFAGSIDNTDIPKKLLTYLSPAP